MDGDSIAADIEAAAAELAGGTQAAERAVTTPEAPETPPEPAQAAETAEAKAARDEKGRFAKVAKEAAEAKAKAEPVKPAPVVEVKPQPVAPVVPAPPKFKAPQAWRPHIRETWGTLPETVQEEVDRLERETKQALNSAAPARKFYDSIQPVLTQHAPLLGPEPVSAIKGMLETAHALKFGTPQQKAQILYELMQDYGVGPEHINPLIEGKAPAATQRQVDPQAIARHVRAEMEREQTEKTRAAAAAEMQTFADAHEFFEDVRADMAALANSGRAKSLEQAYELALRIHEVDPNSDVGKVVRQRKEAAERKKAAEAPVTTNTSVRSSPSGISPIVAGDSIEDDIRAAAAVLKAR